MPRRTISRIHLDVVARHIDRDPHGGFLRSATAESRLLPANSRRLDPTCVTRGQNMPWKGALSCGCPQALWPHVTCSQAVAGVGAEFDLRQTEDNNDPANEPASSVFL